MDMQRGRGGFRGGRGRGSPRGRGDFSSPSPRGRGGSPWRGGGGPHSAPGKFGGERGGRFNRGRGDFRGGRGDFRGGRGDFRGGRGRGDFRGRGRGGNDFRGGRGGGRGGGRDQSFKKSFDHDEEDGSEDDAADGFFQSPKGKAAKGKVLGKQGKKEEGSEDEFEEDEEESDESENDDQPQPKKVKVAGKAKNAVKFADKGGSSDEDEDMSDDESNDDNDMSPPNVKGQPGRTPKHVEKKDEAKGNSNKKALPFSDVLSDEDEGSDEEDLEDEDEESSEDELPAKMGSSQLSKKKDQKSDGKTGGATPKSSAQKPSAAKKLLAMNDESDEDEMESDEDEDESDDDRVGPARKGAVAKNNVTGAKQAVKSKQTVPVASVKTQNEKTKSPAATPNVDGKGQAKSAGKNNLQAKPATSTKEQAASASKTAGGKPSQIRKADREEESETDEDEMESDDDMDEIPKFGKTKFIDDMASEGDEDEDESESEEDMDTSAPAPVKKLNLQLSATKTPTPQQTKTKRVTRKEEGSSDEDAPTLVEQPKKTVTVNATMPSTAKSGTASAQQKANAPQAGAAASKAVGPLEKSGKRKGQDGTPTDAKKPRVADVVVADPQLMSEEQTRKNRRDACSLFIKNLPRKCSEGDIRSLSKDIVNVRRNHQSSFAFVAFVNEKVCEENYKKLNGAKLGGNAITVDYCGEKSTHAQQKGGTTTPKTPEQYEVDRLSLYVGNIPPGVTDDDLKAMFPKCTSTYLNTSRKHSRFGFVRFDNTSNAQEAFKDGQQMMLKNCPVHVSYARASSTKELASAAQTKKPVPAAPQPKASQVKTKGPQPATGSSKRQVTDGAATKASASGKQTVGQVKNGPSKKTAAQDSSNDDEEDDDDDDDVDEDDEDLESGDEESEEDASD